MDLINTVYDSEKQILINTVSGVPDADYYMRSIKVNLDENPLKFVVWDYIAADLSGMTNQDFQNVMSFSVKHPNSYIHEKVALILPTDLSYGLGRMFEAFGENHGAPWQLKPFRSAEEAFRWIDVPDIRKTEKL